jgi:phage terminase small subunit
MQKPAIRAEIEQRQKDKASRAEITADKVLSELAKLAFFDTRKLLNDDGTPKPINELDDDTARAISGIDVVSVGNADFGQGQILKYKISDKNKALEQLCKHLGINAAKKIDHTTNGNAIRSITIVSAEGLVLGNDG